MDYQNIRKQIAYLTALADAHDAVEAGKALAEKAPEPAQDVAAQKLACSNIAIAGSGVKAELCGTISTEPTATAEKLIGLGFDEKQAADMVAEGAAIRVDALELRKPTAEVKP